MCLTTRRNGSAINVVGSADTETTAGECPPESASVSTSVPVGIGLDPSVTSGRKSRVARLDSEGVEEEMEEDRVTGGAPE